MKKNKILKILDEVSQEISFDEKEIKEINSVVQKIKEKVEKNFKFGKVFIGGSFEKGTLLKKDYVDIDIFLIFNKKYKNNISKLALDSLKKIKFIEIGKKRLRFKLQTIHGSRDYFIFSFNYGRNFRIEFIPLLEIKRAGEAENIIDISPLHVKYIKQKLPKESLKEALKDIRLLKAFTAAAGCYGAESYIRGFSGYSLEILIIAYKSFLNLIKKARLWKPIVFIDIEKYYKNKQEALEKINKSKLSPILLIDPVQKERNVLAALSEECFEKFKRACLRFLKNPSKSFFVKRSFQKGLITKKLQKLKRKEKVRVIFVKLLSKAKFDVAGAKCLKFYKELKQLIEKNFEIIKSEFIFNEQDMAEIYFLVKDKKFILIKGPPLSLLRHVKLFKKKHKKTFVKEDIIYAKEKPISIESLNKVIKKLSQRKDFKIRRVKIGIN
ncbi:MAG: nucleotidyltransferase domain-containing protein [Candidatus Pacearchaeota archaeon]